MLNRILLDEIMRLTPDGDDISDFAILAIFGRFDIKVDLLTNDKNELYYSVRVPEILLSDIDTDDLISIRNGKWEYDDSKQCIIKKL